MYNPAKLPVLPAVVIGIALVAMIFVYVVRDDAPPILFVPHVQWSCGGLTCEFRAAASYLPPDPIPEDHDRSLWTFTWVFGDGRSASGAYANHTYAAPRNYSVVVQIITNRGHEEVVALVANVTGVRITSQSFADGSPMPAKHSCYGNPEKEISPHFFLEGLGNLTRTIGLVASEPSANDRLHWVVWNATVETNGTAEFRENELPPGAQESEVYRGPCPQDAGTHEYEFRFYLLRSGLPHSNRPDRFLSSLSFEEHSHFGTYTLLPGLPA